MPDVIVAPEVRDLTTLSRQLTAWLGAQLPEAQDIRLENLAYPFGAGQSHETILFDASWTARGRPEALGCVVRIKPGRHTVFPDDFFEEQYRVMRVMHDGGRVRVARPLWFEPDPSILGAPFFLMEKCRGRVAVSVPPYAQAGWVAEATPAQRAKMWENGVRQLAAIQHTPLSAVQFLRGPDGAREGLPQEWDKYVRFVAWLSRDRPWPVLEAGLKRLADRWPAHQPAGVVWGDARLGNMMFNDQFEVVAVMDWEQPSLGGALHDLAWWLFLSNMMHGEAPGRPHLEGMGTRGETLALWREVTGVPTDDIEWYEDFTALKISCLSIRTAGLKGLPPPDEQALARRLKLV
ncbi:phosphotransferase family protein [Phenylobacterium sp. LjRoot225]|uniref:phosphotransferase family protein n=1 Tax=Phenylobacterium sp. LjRoot225 TaxID=3342285 RepID=UPI003ED10648